MLTAPPTTHLQDMKPHEVAALLCVHPRTVSNWARAGRIRCTRTPGGQIRIPVDVVTALYEGRIDDAAPYPIGVPRSA